MTVDGAAATWADVYTFGEQLPELLRADYLADVSGTERPAWDWPDWLASDAARTLAATLAWSVIEGTLPD